MPVICRVALLFHLHFALASLAQPIYTFRLYLRDVRKLVQVAWAQ